MDQINVKRKLIDDLDDKIMKLLDERFNLTKEIGTIKKQINKEVLDTNREQIVLNKTSNYSHFPQIRAIYNTILKESKNDQRK